MNAPRWLDAALKASEVTDICLNGPELAFTDRGRGLEAVAIPEADRWSHEDMRNWILTHLSAAGRSWDARHPFVDAALTSGHRAHVAFPPLARQGILISLRRLPSADDTGRRQMRWAQEPGYSLLAQAVRDGDSILISGATGSGKTTLAGELLEEVPPHERILALEDTPELTPRHPHFLSLISRPPNADGCGEVTLRTLLRQALRMRPDRVVLGECRGAEVLDLLQVLNTGHRGAMATLHANSPRDALRRAELLCLIAGGGTLPIPAIRELLAVGVQWIAQVRREKGRRVLSELCRVEGREGDTLLLRPIPLGTEPALGVSCGRESSRSGLQSHSPTQPGTLF